MEHTNERWKALRAWLLSSGNATEAELEKLTSDNTYNENYNTFEVLGGEYKVLTDDEAGAAATDEIRSSLWAFNPSFILEHTQMYHNSYPREKHLLMEALGELQGRLCESANPIMEALILDLNVFAEDAIAADGRGHFLSWYDGKEHESGGFYIYRTN